MTHGDDDVMMIYMLLTYIDIEFLDIMVDMDNDHLADPSKTFGLVFFPKIPEFKKKEAHLDHQISKRTT